MSHLIYHTTQVCGGMLYALGGVAATNQKSPLLTCVAFVAGGLLTSLATWYAIKAYSSPRPSSAKGEK